MNQNDTKTVFDAVTDLMAMASHFEDAVVSSVSPERDIRPATREHEALGPRRFLAALFKIDRHVTIVGVALLAIQICRDAELAIHKFVAHIRL
jgi:hypothetical protein